MQTEQELTEAIVKTTMMIHQTYPELSKYIGEMPVKISYKKGSEIHSKNLNNYLESLKSMASKYGLSHTPQKNKQTT